MIAKKKMARKKKENRVETNKWASKAGDGSSEKKNTIGK